MRVRSDGRPIRRTNKKPANRGISTRLQMLLLDGRPHAMNEFWEFLTASVEPQAAIKDVLRRYKGAAEWVRDDPNEAIREGHRLAVLRALKSLEKKGTITVSYPDPVVRDKYHGTAGFIDSRRAVACLTSEGFTQLMEGACIWGRMMSDLYLGVRAGRLEVTIRQKSL